MRTLLLQLFFASIYFGASAQQVQMQVTSNIEEILLQQPWSIDEPQTEFASAIIEGLYIELTSFYEQVNASSGGSINFNFTPIDELLLQASQLEMNLSAFDNDFELVDSYR